MKLLVMLPHGNTVSYLEQQRLALAQMTGKKIFAFTPLYCPLAVMPDQEYSQTEAKTILKDLRDIIASDTKNAECVIHGINCIRNGSITSFFSTVSLPFFADIQVYCKNTGMEQNDESGLGFCIGFSPDLIDMELINIEGNRTIPAASAKSGPHRMTVFRLGIIEFTPEAPFSRKDLTDTTLPDGNNPAKKDCSYNKEKSYEKGGSSKSGTAACHKPEELLPGELSFRWKLISSVWKAKQKGA